MAAATPASLEALLKQLTLAPSDPDHAQILEHCNQVLNSAPAHPRALHTKLVALLNLDRYDDAWHVFESAGAGVADATLEKAYCLYKLGRLDEARAAAVGAADRGDRNARGLRHVEAQAAYRLEDFPRAAEVYKLLADGSTQVDNEDYDMSVNTAATDAQLIWSGVNAHLASSAKAPRGALDAFETAFNAACISSARGELGQALVLLKRAKDLCGAIEDLSEEEKKAEAAPIVAQEVYVLMRMGRVEDAVSRSAELDVENLADTALRLIATNNEISAISRLPSYNPHTALKAAADAASSSSSSSTARPFRFQSRSLEQNSAILDLQVGKLNAVKAAASKRASTDPTDPINGVLHAAAAVAPAGNPTGKEAQTKITKLLSASPHDIGLALTLTQLQIQRTNLTGALQTLGTLTTSLPPAQRFQPGLVGLQVALHQHLGQKAHTKSLLHAASTFWRTAASSPDPALLRAAASAQLDSTEPADLLIAGSLFADLLAANPADTLAACGLVAAYATTDPARITPQHLAALPDVERLIADIDAAALEAGGVAVQPRGKRAADDDDDDGTARPRERVKKVRRKKTKVPALLVGKTPDAERWLPVRDRSSYRPKGKKGKKAVGATQGGVVVAEAEADATKEVKKVVGPGGGGGAGKKKKKKAGKR